jgi:hypothetical protein
MYIDKENIQVETNNTYKLGIKFRGSNSHVNGVQGRVLIKTIS